MGIFNLINKIRRGVDMRKDVNIMVCDYRTAFEYVYNHSDKDDTNLYSIISIQENHGDVGFGFEYKAGGRCVSALNISFSDCDDKLVGSEMKLMTDEDALRIKEFIENIPDEVEDLIIHCHAGVSRSAAVAAAISLVYKGDDKKYFSSHVPNRYVYRKVLKAFGLENSYGGERK